MQWWEDWYSDHHPPYTHVSPLLTIAKILMTAVGVPVVELSFIGIISSPCCTGVRTFAIDASIFFFLKSISKVLGGTTEDSW